jgi:predicted anti-sigma-YlaC factor YlaD
MNCREFVDFLMSYLDEEIEAAPRRVFEEHMRLCPPCGVYLDTYRDTIRLGKFACKEDASGLPDEVPDELIRAILAAREA